MAKRGYRQSEAQKLDVRKQWRHPKTWPQMILYAIRHRAKKSGLAFDLTVDDIVVPEECPVLGIKIELGAVGAKANAPSVDRFDNTKGYVKGNIRIISKRVNSLKSDATVAELKAVLAYMEGRAAPFAALRERKRLEKRREQARLAQASEQPLP
jgi:hypothetical protein